MNDLIEKAIQMMGKAQAPYSKYSVGAAIKTDEELIIGGCNIENASYPLSICAERTALFSAIAQGYRKFSAMAIATKSGGYPCGSCRQVIWELCGNIPIYICDKNGVINETTRSTLLPEPFEAKDLKSGNILGADANCGWKQHDAIRVINAVSDLDIYIEQPCLTYEECKAVRKKCHAPSVKILINNKIFQENGLIIQVSL